jgi:hypothetical protein
MSAPPFAFIVPECHTGRDNEGTTKDKKAPTLQKGSVGKNTFIGYNIFEKSLTFAPNGCIL